MRTIFGQASPNAAARRAAGSRNKRFALDALDAGASVGLNFERDVALAPFTPLNRALISNASSETLDVTFDVGALRARVLPQSDELVAGADVNFRSIIVTNVGSGATADGEVEVNVQRTARGS